MKKEHMVSRLVPLMLAFFAMGFVIWSELQQTM